MLTNTKNADPPASMPVATARERLVLFTKQPANLPLTYVHADGVLYEPGCGVAMQTDANEGRVSACREIDIVCAAVWIRAEIAAVRTNASSGVDVFYTAARRMTGPAPKRTRGPGYVRYVSVSGGDVNADA